MEKKREKKESERESVIRDNWFEYTYIYVSLIFFAFSIAEEDFSTVIKTLEFHSGDKYIDVNVPIINDKSIEGNETFTIYLTSDVGVNVSPYVQSEVTIIDDDRNDDKADEDDDKADDDEGTCNLLILCK